MTKREILTSIGKECRQIVSSASIVMFCEGDHAADMKKVLPEEQAKLNKALDSLVDLRNQLRETR